MDALKQNNNVFCSVSPFQVNKALFISKTLEQTINGWHTVGEYQVRFEKWGHETVYSERKAPSYGG